MSSPNSKIIDSIARILHKTGIRKRRPIHTTPLTLASIGQMEIGQAEASIKERVQCVYIGNDTMLARVLGYPKMFLDARDIGLSCHLMLDGFWELWLTQLLARIVKPGMVAIDVGANLGYYSVLMGLGVAPGGRLIAVEGNPVIAKLLARSLELNGIQSFSSVAQIVACQVGEGHANFFVPASEPKNARIVADDFESPDGACISVPRGTIDQLTADLTRVDIVKIDVEGAEVDVIVGMAKTIERFKPDIVLEFNVGRVPDPDGFLHSLEETYGMPWVLRYDGWLHPITREEALGANDSEDLLLFFTCRNARDISPLIFQG